MENRQRILSVNNEITENSGIYFLLRRDENGFKYAYIGQALHLLTRLAQHLGGYDQHIDKSLKKHGLFHPIDRPYGWQVYALECPPSLLDECEQKYILNYANAGWQLRNKTSGSQGVGKSQIDDYKPHKTYRDGLEQGRKAILRDLKHIADKHLTIELKAEKKANKTSQKQLEKFMAWLNESEEQHEQTETDN